MQFFFAATARSCSGRLAIASGGYRRNMVQPVAARAARSFVCKHRIDINRCAQAENAHHLLGRCRTSSDPRGRSRMSGASLAGVTCCSPLQKPELGGFTTPFEWHPFLYPFSHVALERPLTLSAGKTRSCSHLFARYGDQQYSLRAAASVWPGSTATRLTALQPAQVAEYTSNSGPLSKPIPYRQSRPLLQHMPRGFACPGKASECRAGPRKADRAGLHFWLLNVDVTGQLGPSNRHRSQAAKRPDCHN